MNPQPVSLADELRGALARGYCHAENSRKVLDSDLIEAMREEIEALLRQHAVAEPQEVTISGSPAIYSVNDPQHRTMAWQPSFSAHAAEQPKLTEPFRTEHLEVLLSGRFGISSVTGAADLAWLADQLNKLRSLPTSPVAPPPRHEPPIMRWRCPQCDYVNGMELTKCENCKSPLPLAKAPPVAPGEQPPRTPMTESVPRYHCTFCDGDHHEDDCPNRCTPTAPPAQERASDERRVEIWFDESPIQGSNRGFLRFRDEEALAAGPPLRKEGGGIASGPVLSDRKEGGGK